MAKLWQKSYQLDELLEAFTVGRDYILDLELGVADCAGSVAHARMLNAQGYLSDQDIQLLEKSLTAIAAEFSQRRFTIERSDEDCHSAIEQRLTADVGEPGKRIHLGRSRNDQVLTMLRLYGREYLLEIRKAVLQAVSHLLAFAREYEHAAMPGRTHMQIAMPSSLGLWAASYAEDFLDGYSLLQTAFELFNRSPLGTAAGYGVPLNIDRQYTADLMGFPSLQNNVLSVQNSRGRLEAAVASALDQIALSYSKLAQDLILFSLPEFGYFELPDELCTGSSIMPQKKNPDGLELLRSRAASISGWTTQLSSIIRSLPGGYNRDFQDTKEPFLRVLHTSLPAIQIVSLTIKRLKVNINNLISAHRPEIFATDRAIDLVKKGMSFRDAYREIAKNPDDLPEGGGEDLLKKLLEQRTSLGTPGNLNLEGIESLLAVHTQKLEKQELHHFEAVEHLLPGIGSLIPPVR